MDIRQTPSAGRLDVLGEKLTSERSAPAPCSTVYEVVRRQAVMTPDAMAVGAPGRPPLSYRGLLARLGCTVDTLRGIGVRRNDRVAVVMPNGAEMAVSFLGVAAGATCAPLNPALPAGEFDFYMSDLRARALVVWSALESPGPSGSPEAGHSHPRSAAACRCGGRSVRVCRKPTGASGAARRLPVRPTRRWCCTHQEPRLGPRWYPSPTPTSARRPTTSRSR